MYKYIITFCVVLLFSVSAFSADDTELSKAFSDIYHCEVDTSTTLDITDFILEHNSLIINFKSGQLSFFKPVTIDSTQIYFGAYYRGEGNIFFKPPVMMEQDQLKRFIGRDSIDSKFSEIFLLFSQEIYEKIVGAQFPHAAGISKGDLRKAKKLRESMIKYDHNSYFFWTLKNLINPTPYPYLVVNVQPQNHDRYYYCYNPFEREEIQLYKGYWEPGNTFMELVNSYSQYNIDEQYININGRSKEQLQIKHYDIEASIDRKGIYRGETKVTFNVTTQSLQLVEFNLNPELKINSITDSTGSEVEFIRYELKTTFKKYDSYEVGIIFDRPLMYGETVTLNFNYEGEIVDRELGEYFVQAGAHWYPRYGYRQLATFDMTFKTDNDFTFIATGVKTEERNIKDTLITSWKVTSPAANISFNIGFLKKYLYEESDLVPIEVYYSKDIHNSIANYLGSKLIAVGKNMQNQIAEDVKNSIRVYQHIFGPYPYENLVVSEILYRHGEAFPGFLHLGFSTWINTDPWGSDNIFRAHEVAHQWWGVQVGYETYHDQWLSEGFATYSSLMYYQAITTKKNKKKFLNKLKEYRNDIFSVRKYFLGSGEESGPIALGYRTASTKTEGDYGLIIYKKGAFVLHMLRNMLIDLKTMNENRFNNMLKEFYSKYRGKKATTANFQLIAEKYVGTKLDWFFNQWIYRNELPTYEFSYSYEKDASGNYIAKGKIITKNVSDDFKMYLPLEIVIDDKSKAYVRLFVDKPVYEFDLPGLPKKPKKIRLNPFESVLAKIEQ